MPSKSNEAEDMKKKYRNEYREILPGYTKSKESKRFDKLFYIFAEFCALSEDDFVLDVGCGSGRGIGGIKRFTSNVVGVDFLPEAIQDARKELGQDTSLVQSDALHLPFRDNSFDCVVSCFLWHSIPRNYRSAFLTELARVSKNKVVLGRVPNSFAMKLDIYVHVHNFRKRIGDNKKQKKNIFIPHHYFTHNEIKKLFLKAGLVIEDIRPSSSLYIMSTRHYWLQKLIFGIPRRIAVFGRFLPDIYSCVELDIKASKKRI